MTGLGRLVTATDSGMSETRVSVESVRVFLSSTRRDLVDERDAVYAELSQYYDVVRMEDFGSRGDDALETCLSEVESCDAYVLLLGHRYGTIARRYDLSYTEIEYERARESRIEVLAYVKRGFDVALDDADHPTRLKNFYDMLQDAHTLRHPYFSDPSELATQVREDLGRWANRRRARPRFGRRAAAIMDSLAYSVGTTKQRQLQLRPFVVTLIDLSVLEADHYPAGRGRRLRRKVLEVYSDIKDDGANVIIFNDLPAYDPSPEERTQVRIAEVRDNAHLAVCFVRGEPDAAELARLQLCESILAVWQPERLGPPTAVVPLYWERYSDQDLQECLVALRVNDYVRHRIDAHLVSGQ